MRNKSLVYGTWWFFSKASIMPKYCLSLFNYPEQDNSRFKWNPSAAGDPHQSMIHQQISQFATPQPTDSPLHGDNTLTQIHPLSHSVTKRPTFSLEERTLGETVSLPSHPHVFTIFLFSSWVNWNPEKQDWALFSAWHGRTNAKGNTWRNGDSLGHWLL